MHPTGSADQSNQIGELIRSINQIESQIQRNDCEIDRLIASRKRAKPTPSIALSYTHNLTDLTSHLLNAIK